MTARSFAELRDSAISLVGDARPDISVKSLKMKRLGAIRLAQVTLESVEYAQFPLPPLGTSVRHMAAHIAQEIIGMKEMPSKAA